MCQREQGRGKHTGRRRVHHVERHREVALGQHREDLFFKRKNKYKGLNENTCHVNKKCLHGYHGPAVHRLTSLGTQKYIFKVYGHM